MSPIAIARISLRAFPIRPLTAGSYPAGARLSLPGDCAALILRCLHRHSTMHSFILVTPHHFLERANANAEDQGPGRPCALRPPRRPLHRATRILTLPCTSSSAQHARPDAHSACDLFFFLTPPRALRGNTQPYRTHPATHTGRKRTARDAAHKPRSQTRKITPQQLQKRECSRRRGASIPRTHSLWAGLASDPRAVRALGTYACGPYCKIQ